MAAHRENVCQDEGVNVRRCRITTRAERKTTATTVPHPTGGAPKARPRFGCQNRSGGARAPDNEAPCTLPLERATCLRNTVFDAIRGPARRDPIALPDRQPDTAHQRVTDVGHRRGARAGKTPEAFSATSPTSPLKVTNGCNLKVPYRQREADTVDAEDGRSTRFKRVADPARRQTSAIQRWDGVSRRRADAHRRRVGFITPRPSLRPKGSAAGTRKTVVQRCRHPNAPC